jgi:hypothetical protein
MSVDRPAWMSAAEHDATACRLPTTTGDPGRLRAVAHGSRGPLPGALGGAVIRPSFYTLLTLLSSQTRALQPPTVLTSLWSPVAGHFGESGFVSRMGAFGQRLTVRPSLPSVRD